VPTEIFALFCRVPELDTLGLNLLVCGPSCSS
jgi:hypothetical protein